MTTANWYWIDGTAYCPACVECDTPAIDVAVATRGPCEHGRCGCCAAEAGNKNYSLAFVKTDGSWDIPQTFVAVDDDAANEWAEQHYADQEWYVLDAAGRNINGGAR